LVARLWDIPGLAAAAHSLIDRIDERERGRGDLPTAFSLAAEVLRFLRSEPLLPAELTPPAWPVDDLRRRYEALERDVQTMLRPILTASA
jgi:phenylacetic acid degradation operon negative regulatory protein